MVDISKEYKKISKVVGNFNQELIKEIEAVIHSKEKDKDLNDAHQFCRSLQWTLEAWKPRFIGK